MYCAGKIESYQNEKFMRGCRFLEAELQDMDRILAGRYGEKYLFSTNHHTSWPLVGSLAQDVDLTKTSLFAFIVFW